MFAAFYGLTEKKAFAFFAFYEFSNKLLQLAHENCGHFDVVEKLLPHRVRHHPKIQSETSVSLSLPLFLCLNSAHVFFCFHCCCSSPCNMRITRVCCVYNFIRIQHRWWNKIYFDWTFFKLIEFPVHFTEHFLTTSFQTILLSSWSDNHFAKKREIN